MIVKPGQTMEEVMAGHRKMVVDFFTRTLQTVNLEKFRKEHEGKYEIKEVNPPCDNIAYFCAYKFMHHTDQSLCASIEQYWDKDGNCIGFMYGEKRYMFADEKSAGQMREDLVQRFKDGQRLVDVIVSTKIPENSDMAKFIAERPGAKVTSRVVATGKLVYVAVDERSIGGVIVEFNENGKEIRRVGIKSMTNQRD